ncbi:MAG: hypothetical protein LBQ27_00790 [Clostridiales bacterium]|jgi:hypothetical protein|nr:hypothetical protein [Clostridiales bacterium]
MTDVLVMKRSNLVLPNGFVEIDREEMSYVEGGISLSSNGLYFSQNDILAVTFAFGTNPYLVAAGLSALSSWICSSGIGVIIWGLFSVSSTYIAIKALAALSQDKGLMISVEWEKIWCIPVPCGLSFTIQ